MSKNIQKISMVVIGDTGVGKSCLLLQLVDRRFSSVRARTEFCIDSCVCIGVFERRVLHAWLDGCFLTFLSLTFLSLYFLSFGFLSLTAGA
jgi:hypothetical protein